MFVSIKTHVILLLIFATTLPFILLRIFAYPVIQSDLKTVVMNNLEIIGHKQAELVTNWMRERMKDAIVVASNPYMANSIEITPKDKEYKNTVIYLEKILAEYGYKGAFISNNEGFVTLATSEERIGNDISKKDFFQQAMKGKTFASNIVPSEIPLTNEYDEYETGLPTMFVSTPLKDEKEAIVGIVVLRIHVGVLSNLLQSYTYGKTGETYLVGKDGYMLTESRFTRHLKRTGAIRKRSALEVRLVEPNTSELTYGVKQCIAGKSGSHAKGYSDYSGIPVLGVWNWLPEFNWGVITEIDRTEAYGAAYNLKYIVSALMLAIAFPFLFIAYVLGSKLSNPIIKLREVIEEITSGDLTKRVDIKSNNEIGILATAFNTMTKALDKKTKEIVSSEKRYRDLFDSLKEGVYQCEPGIQGVFTWINQAGAEIFGYKSPEEIVGTKVKDIYADPADRRRLIEKLEKEEVCRNFESFCKKRTGERFHTERTTSLIRNEEGEPVLIEGIIRDITERKILEEELKKSEKRHRELLNSLKEGVYQCEPGIDGVFTWVNQAGAEIFGYKSPEEMVGTGVKDIYVDPEDRKRLVWKLEKEDVCRNFESYCKKKTGEHFYTERTASLIRDEEGEPVLIEGIIRDITERKIFEEKLKKSEKHYRELLNSLKEGVYQCEPGIDGVFTWINQAGADMFGYKSPEEIVGTNVKNIYADPADRRRLVEKLEQEDTCRNFVSYCKKKNGERFYLERTSSMIRDEKDIPVMIEGIMRDITERKELEDKLKKSEKHYKDLLNSLKEGVYQCEPGIDGVFTWINQAGADMFGYRSPEEMTGKKVKDIYVDPEDRTRLIEKLKKEGVCRNFESYCRKKNGERFYTERTTNLIWNEKGEPERVEGIIRDITERKKLEEESEEFEKNKEGKNKVS